MRESATISKTSQASIIAGPVLEPSSTSSGDIGFKESDKIAAVAIAKALAKAQQLTINPFTGTS